LIYLDHNATTPIRPEVRTAMLPFFDESFGNPSSPHTVGRRVAGAVDGSRAQVADALGVAADTIHFTSGGTEADNWALKGVLDAHWLKHRSHGRLVTSSTEHHAVLDTANTLARHGVTVAYQPVDENGIVDVQALMEAVAASPAPQLVSLLHANNETGVLQPVAQIGAALRERGVLFHVDAVQSLGKVDLQELAQVVDLMSISAHKTNGPKGTGALYIRPGVEIEPLLHGGGQEQGRRPGTLHAAGIVGFGAAVEAATHDGLASMARLGELRDRLQDGLSDLVGDVVVHGGNVDRLAQTLSVSFVGVEAEAVLLGLDQVGIAAASGSACTSDSPEPSHVLLAMGVEPRVASSAVRFSLGWGNDEAQIDQILEMLPPLIARLREMSVF